MTTVIIVLINSARTILPRVSFSALSSTNRFKPSIASKGTVNSATTSIELTVLNFEYIGM